VALEDLRDLLGEVVQLAPLVGDQAQRLGDDADGLQPTPLFGGDRGVRSFL
jgi:hypothetical protein